MKNLLYILAIILVISWFLGFLGFFFGGLIHVFLSLALIAVILQLLMGKKI